VGDGSVRLSLPPARGPGAEALLAQINATRPPSLRERGIQGARSYLEERAAAGPADLPPTTLLLSGCDPLVAEGLAYADRLWTAGVSVDLHLYAGQIHGFLTLDDSILPRSREAVGLVAIAIHNS
jgi:acetyl esterase/lipase